LQRTTQINDVAHLEIDDEVKFILYIYTLISNSEAVVDLLGLSGAVDNLIDYLDQSEHFVFPIDYKVGIFWFPDFFYEQHIFVRGPPKITYCLI
jgi:hypothetical protein